MLTEKCKIILHFATLSLPLSWLVMVVPLVNAVVKVSHHLDGNFGAVLQRPAGPLVAVPILERLLQDDLIRALVLLAEVGLLVRPARFYIFFGQPVLWQVGAEILGNKTEDFLFEVDGKTLR